MSKIRTIKALVGLTGKQMTEAEKDHYLFQGTGGCFYIEPKIDTCVKCHRIAKYKDLRDIYSGDFDNNPVIIALREKEEQTEKEEKDMFYMSGLICTKCLVKVNKKKS